MEAYKLTRLVSNSRQNRDSALNILWDQVSSAKVNVSLTGGTLRGSFYDIKKVLLESDTKLSDGTSPVLNTNIVITDTIYCEGILDSNGNLTATSATNAMGVDNVDKLNQIMRLTNKTVTASLEGWAEILDDLDNTSSSSATQIYQL